MGYKHYVGTSVVRMVEDNQLPNSIIRGGLSAITNNQEDQMLAYVQEEFMGSVAMKAEKMYQYAVKGNYFAGLPSGKFTSDTDGLELLQPLLNKLEGASVSIEYSHYGRPNLLHLAWSKLVSNYDYNPDTNIIGVYKSPQNGAVYLQDMHVVVPTDTLKNYDLEELDTWGIAASAGYTPQRQFITPQMASVIVPTPPGEAPLMGAVARITYCGEQTVTNKSWADQLAGKPTTTQLFQKTVDTPLVVTDEIALYFQVKYKVNGVIKYWTYKVGSGTYPDLDTFDEASEDDTKGVFYPFVYFRYEKESPLEPKFKDSAWYKTSKKLMKQMGTDFDTLVEEIHSDENESINDIEQAMFMMAVPANTKNEYEQRYLFEFFDNAFYARDSLDTETSNTTDAINDLLERHNTTRRENYSITIKDKKFKTKLSTKGIYKEIKVGVLGAIDTYHSGFTKETQQTQYINYDKETGKTTTATRSVDTDFHYYRKQIAANLYEEIKVVDLTFAFNVWGGMWTTGDDDGKILLVPVDRSVIRKWNIADKEQIVARSMHLIFNSHVAVKTKWYESGIFKIVVIIIAVIITILSWGTLSPVATAMVGALGIAVVGPIAIAIANILAMLVVSVALKLVIKIVGPKIGMVIAILAICYGVATSQTAAEGAATAVKAGASAVQAAPWARELIMAGIGLAGNASTEYIKDQFSGLAEDMKEFEVIKETKLAQLETAEELLNGSNSLLSPIVIFGETPQEFFERTIHSGNIGTLAIDAIHNYVDIKLALPTFNDTIGGFA